MHVCCGALWLLFATMICLGSFSVSLNTNHTGFFISVYVCRGALWLRFATMICFGKLFIIMYVCWCCALWPLLATMICFCFFFVLLITGHPFFCISMHVCRCAPWLLLATTICFGPFSVLLITIHQRFSFPFMCVVVLCRCCVPP